MTRPHSATATIGIAMGAAGTDVAMETADVVLVSDNLWNIPFAISISRHARTVIWQNLAIAMSVIVVLMASALGFSLPLTVGVVGHEGARYSSASMDYGSSRSKQREPSSQNLLSITPAPAAEASDLRAPASRSASMLDATRPFGFPEEQSSEPGVRNRATIGF
jgi:hypothetical protein